MEGAAPIIAFPHIASQYLTLHVVDPLIALCSTRPGVELVFRELVSAVEHAWQFARVEYPDVADIKCVDFVWCSGMDRIDGRLAELKALVAA